MSQYTPDEQRLLGTPYRGIFLFSLFFICCFNFADRAIFAVLAEAIKVDLALTDFEIGLLQGLAFAVLYGALGIPFGRLAERHHRIGIIAIATTIWSAATAFCGMAQSFTQLMLARIGVGMGEAGFLPPTSSLVADHFPARRRATAMSLIMLGTPAGTLLGSIIAGWVAQAYGWRMAFYVLGLPGIAAALLVWLVLREPPRGLIDNAPRSAAPVPGFGEFMRVVIERRALRYLVIGYSFAGFCIMAIASFLNVFLQRVHHLPVRESGTLYGLISGVSIAIGLLVGALSSDWLAQKDKRWAAWIATAGLMVAPVVYFVAFRLENVTQAAVLLTAAAAVLLLFYGPTLGMMQNLLEPRMRATGMGLFTTFYTLFGSGLGPAFVGLLSDRIAQQAFGAQNFGASCPGGVAPAGAPEALVQACLDASAIGIQKSLSIAMGACFIAGAFYFMASRTLREDLHVAAPTASAVPAK